MICKIGWHRWSTRELHCTEPFNVRAEYLQMAIIERCKCGKSRIPPSGNDKPTLVKIVVSNKYMPETMEQAL